jgi:hypothetical protein
MRIGALVLLLWSSCAAAQWDVLTWVDPRLDWRTLQTKNFEIHFPEQRRADARRVAEAAESVYPKITSLLRWEPAARTHVLIMDSADFSNGFATPLPFNETGIFLAPPDDGELLQNRAWLELVLSHELFHIVHLDKARGFPLGMRNIFGRLWWSFPNALQPSWIIEGLAVRNESDPARGYGRLENTQFEGMLRAEAERGLRPLAEINADGRGFPLNRDYLYGSYFFAFLKERYGEDAIYEFIDNYSGKFLWFPVDSNPEAATGKTMTRLWAEYDGWLRARFAPRAGFAPAEGEELARAWTIFSPVLSPSGERWYIQGNGYTLPRLVRQPRGGSPDSLRDVESDTRAFAHGADSVLLSQLEICDNYNLYYDLYWVDGGGGRKRLTDCSRNRFAAPLEDGRIAVVRLRGTLAEVLLLDAAGKPLRTVYRAAPDESIGGLAARGDSIVITSLRDDRWSLIDVGGAEPAVLVADAAIKHSPRFGRSADEIFFIADYGKVYNLWSAKRSGRSLERWTQARTGVKEISAPVDGEILLTTIEPDGDVLRLYRLPQEPLERREAAAPSAEPAKPAAETPPNLRDRPYSPWSSLRPHSWLPALDFADGAFAVGVATYGADALGLHQYVFAPLYETTQHQVLGDAQYVYDNRHGVMLNRTMTVHEQDSDNKIRRYSIKENAQWVSLWRDLALSQRFYWGVGAAAQQEKEHIVDDGTISQQRERVVGLVAGVDTRRQQWLSEGPSQGQWLRLFAETSEKLKAAYTGNVVRADWRASVPVHHSVLALRWNEAYGTTDAQPFSLGGSKSDDYAILPVLNERDFALRGYLNGAPGLVGHRARAMTAEVRTPIADIDRQAMSSFLGPIGINRLSFNAFFDMGDAWEHGDKPDYHRGVGIELMSEPRYAYVFGGLFRLGIARGLNDQGETKVYLKVGRSF